MRLQRAVFQCGGSYRFFFACSAAAGERDARTTGRDRNVEQRRRGSPSTPSSATDFSASRPRFR